MLQFESTNNPCDKLYEHILLQNRIPYDSHKMTKITMAEEEAIDVSILTPFYLSSAV